jgi:hypothetical protein
LVAVKAATPVGIAVTNSLICMLIFLMKLVSNCLLGTYPGVVQGSQRVKDVRYR